MRTKKRRLISFVSLSFALIIMTTLMLGSVVMAAPTSDMLVIDNADMLTKEEEQTIESALYQIYKQTDIEYVVYLAPSLDGEKTKDPHIWFSVKNWKAAAKEVAKGFSEKDPKNKSYYEDHLNAYLAELDNLDKYIRKEVESVPKDSRILVTAHDAFAYFARDYGFEVKGIQGISTASEAGTSDISTLAAFIADHKIKAVFVESSVPHKTIESLQAAVKARGFDVSIGGELYSDSLGGESTKEGTYIGMYEHNIKTITEALR